MYELQTHKSHGRSNGADQAYARLKQLRRHRGTTAAQEGRRLRSDAFLDALHALALGVSASHMHPPAKAARCSDRLEFREKGRPSGGAYLKTPNLCANRNATMPASKTATRAKRKVTSRWRASSVKSGRRFMAPVGRNKSLTMG